MMIDADLPAIFRIIFDPEEINRLVEKDQRSRLIRSIIGISASSSVTAPSSSDLSRTRLTIITPYSPFLRDPGQQQRDHVTQVAASNGHDSAAKVLESLGADMAGICDCGLIESLGADPRPEEIPRLMNLGTNLRAAVRQLSSFSAVL